MNCGTSHGHSVASGLSVIWEYMLDNNGEEAYAGAYDRFDEIGTLLGGKNAREGLEIFNNILKEFELPYPKTDSKNIPIFTSKVDVTRLGNNPIKFTSADVMNIYKEVFAR